MCISLAPGAFPLQPTHGHLQVSRKGQVLPEDAAWKEDLILYLMGGATGNLHIVFILLLYLVSYMILLGDVTPIVDLKAEHGMNWNVYLSQASPFTFSP